MPRNGLGQFVLPPLYNPVQGGTIITTAWGNTTLDDIAAALSTSIATDGQTSPTANLPMAGFRHTNVGASLSLLQYARTDQVQGWAFNVVTNVGADVTGTAYTGTIPFNIGNGTVVIPNLMPILFVPSVNNGGPSTLALNTGPVLPILNQNLTQLTAGQIRAGRPYALCYLAGNWILVTNTIELTQLNSLYLQLAGGTMAGSLLLDHDPAQPMEAATRQWVLSQVSGSVAGVASFNGRVGAVTQLSSDITNALLYTPLNQAGGTISGNLVVNGAVTTPEVLANRYKVNIVRNDAATGTITVNPNTVSTNYIFGMTGNITLNIAENMIVGNILRLTFYNTAGRTITWPATIYWPMPLQLPPVIDTGAVKAIVVVLMQYGTANVWVGNASVY